MRAKLTDVKKDRCLGAKRRHDCLVGLDGRACSKGPCLDESLWNGVDSAVQP